ncbi:translation repressor protein [Aeromonas phage 65]|uniref:Translation repressor protein n=2 Tax=Ishigurovirus osborne TaxID=260149 RepID=A0A219YBM2_9CAUD|nr:translation repressor protein [Aeromonas phage 65]AAR90915.1 translation repressor protein [Aeromonas phage 65]APU01414.1 RegA [Aeromonas phage 65.2]UYD59383.1 translation repressor protein [Aeromonas phage avDM6]
MIRIGLYNPQDFLKVRETLTRIGIANRETKHIWQSCHIIQKNGFYYVAHFKELLRRDGRDVVMSQEDVDRCYDIAYLLEDWDLCSVIDTMERPNRFEFHVISHKEKSEWIHKSKYIFKKNVHS